MSRLRLGRRFILTATVVVVLFPYLVALVTVFKPDSEIAGPQQWLPVNPTWDEITGALAHSGIWTYIKNSAIIALGTTAVVLFCAIPAAYVLSRHQFAGRKSYLDIILVTQMMAPVVLIVAIFRIMSWAGLLGSYWSVIIASSAFLLPFSIWLLVGFFRAMSAEIEESARLDGCGRFRMMVDFVVPLAKPGLVTTGLFAFLYGWNEFVFSLTFLSSEPQRWPITIGVFRNIGQWTVNWQAMLVMVIVASIPVLVAFAILERQFEAGLSPAVR